jgi:hypothetical protein
VREIRVKVNGIAPLQGIFILADAESQLAAQDLDELDSHVFMELYCARFQWLKLGVIDVQLAFKRWVIEAFEVEGQVAPTQPFHRRSVEEPPPPLASHPTFRGMRQRHCDRGHATLRFADGGRGRSLRRLAGAARCETHFRLPCKADSRYVQRAAGSLNSEWLWISLRILTAHL